MFEKSILLQKSGLPNVGLIYKESVNRQISIYKETLEDMEEALDTGELDEMNPKSLNIFKKDILDIIGGVRKLKTKKDILAKVTSVDRILENLRSARDIIFNTRGMFVRNKLKDTERKEFFSEMKRCRDYLAVALGGFR